MTIEKSMKWVLTRWWFYLIWVLPTIYLMYNSLTILEGIFFLISGFLRFFIPITFLRWFFVDRAKKEAKRT